MLAWCFGECRQRFCSKPLADVMQHISTLSRAEFGSGIVPEDGMGRLNVMEQEPVTMVVNRKDEAGALACVLAWFRLLGGDVSVEKVRVEHSAFPESDGTEEVDHCVVDVFAFVQCGYVRVMHQDAARMYPVHWLFCK